MERSSTVKARQLHVTEGKRAAEEEKKWVWPLQLSVASCDTNLSREKKNGSKLNVRKLQIK